MKQFLKKYLLQYCMFCCCLLQLVPLAAQQASPICSSLGGSIVNEQNEPVAASITVKGSHNAAATDSRGNFVLENVPPDAILLVTGVGIRSFEIPVKGRCTLPAWKAVTKIKEQAEVIIEANTGYQTIKPNEMNGSVVVIDNKTLNQQVGTNILNRLNGVSSGVLFNIGKSNSNPQNSTGISIRGLSTINGPLDPLIVMDGFIYEGNIDNINPNDVESITILKDAAAASVWGARAGNGVIVISTKRGRLNQPMQLSVNAGVIVQEKPDLFYLPQMSSADYVNVETLLFNAGYFDDRINYEPYKALTPSVNILLQQRNGSITGAEATAQLNQLKTIDARNQYTHYMYQPGVTQQYQLSLRGGSGNNAYTFSAGYDHNQSDLKALFKKLNVKAENVYQPFKKLRLEASLYFTSSQEITGAAGYGTIRPAEREVPYYSIANADGKALPVATVYNPAFTDTSAGGKLLDWKYYPLDDYRHDNTGTHLQEIYARLGISYSISNALSIDLKYQYEVQQNKTERLADVNSYEARNTINSFSQWDPSTGVITYIIPPGGIRTLTNAAMSSQTIRGQLNFKKAWGNHALNAIAGAELRQVKGWGDTYTAYGYNADPLTVAATDFVNGYPDFIYGYLNGISGSPTSSNTVNRFVSVYANAAYIFNNRYSLSASARRDGSNIFGANTNDKWKPLWSVGAGWKLSDEHFYRVKWMELLRLKISYGYSGNVDLSKTAYPVAMSVGNDNFTNYPYTRIQTLNNPDLRWEQSRQLNLGVEFALQNNVLSGSVEFYKKQGIDLYGETLYDYTSSGIGNVITKNVANTSGNGIDVIVNSKNIDRQIKWNSSLLLSHNKTITAKYYSPNANKAHLLTGGGNSIIPVVGKELYGIVAYRWGGLDNQGNPQGYLDGKLSTDYVGIGNEVGEKELESSSIVYVGSGTPHWFGSLINTVSYKRFSLSINVAFKLGYYAFKRSINYEALINAGGGHADFAKRWQQPGDEASTNVPSFVYPNDSYRDNFYTNSMMNVLKADHIRLQYIHLSWSPVLKIGQQNTFKGLELYANAANLGILWRANTQHIDPDYPDRVPPAKTWAVGIRCNF